MNKWFYAKKWLSNIAIVILFILSFIIFYQDNLAHKNDDKNSNILILNSSLSEEKPNEEFKNISPNVDFDEIRKKYRNDEIIARLEIPNILNLLITKGNDNEFYLNHNIDKSNDVSGNEFMDYRVMPTSKQVNIYGHNAYGYNLPFKELMNYSDKDFYEKNPYIILQHEKGKRFYKIFSFKIVTTDYEHMKINVNNNIEHIKRLKANSIHTTDIQISEDSNIIVLQTCTYNNSYYVLSAIEI